MRKASAEVGSVDVQVLLPGHIDFLASGAVGLKGLGLKAYLHSACGQLFGQPNR